MRHPASGWRSVWAVLLVLAGVLPARTLRAADDRGDRRGAPQAAGPALTLNEAVARGLAHHHTAVSLGHAVDEARGQARTARSPLLPDLSLDLTATTQEVNLTALGVRLDHPPAGLSIPAVSGPYAVVDARGRLTQSLFDRTARFTYQSAGEMVDSAEHALADARDMVAYAVATAYFEAMAARAQLQAARARLETATAILERARQRQAAGLATELDGRRAEVQVLLERQRQIAREGELAKRRIALARLIGLPPGATFDLAAELTFVPAPPLTLEAALAAAEQRADLRAADSRVRAAEYAAAAARATRLPSVAVSADYGISRASSQATYPTFSVAGVLRVPVWQGGRAEGETGRTAAALARRRAEAADLRAAAESEVRMAFVDLDAAAGRVEVSRATLEVVRDSLALARQRFDAGLDDNVSVVQEQQSLAAAEVDYLDSIVRHTLAKAGLLRAAGRAAGDIVDLLRVP